MKGGIVYKDVDGTERNAVFPGHSVEYGMLPMSPWEEDGFGNETFGLPGVHLFG